MYAANLSIFSDTYTREQQKNLILLHSINFFSYKLIIRILLSLICFVAFQLISIKDDSIHYLLSY